MKSQHQMKSDGVTLSEFILKQVRFDKIKIMQEIIIKGCSIAREVIGRHLA